MPSILDTLEKKIDALEQRLRVAQSNVPAHHICLDFGDFDAPTIEQQKQEFLTQHNLESEQELHEAGGHFVEVSLPWLKGLRDVGNKLSTEEYLKAGQQQSPRETPYMSPEPIGGNDTCSLTKGDE